MYVPSHAIPFIVDSLYPSLHWHLKDPRVLIQIASFSQLSVSSLQLMHSSTSETLKRNTVITNGNYSIEGISDLIEIESHYIVVK